MMSYTSINTLPDGRTRAFFSWGRRISQYLGPARATIAEARADRRRFVTLNDRVGTREALRLCKEGGAAKELAGPIKELDARYLREGE